MIRAKYSPESENLAKASQGCKMFHVEHCCFDGGNQVSEGELFHVEHLPLPLVDGPGWSCFTWIDVLPSHSSVPAQCD